MDVKEAVAKAKAYVSDLFSGEPILNLGLEEIEYDEKHQRWIITIGFSRSWDKPVNEPDFVSRLEGKQFYLRRSYKTILISDPDGNVVSVKNRAA